MLYDGNVIIVESTPNKRNMIKLINFFCLLVEVVEQACGMASLQMGEFVPNASNGVDTYCIREPLGVCAGICTFNFSAVISLWVCLVILL